MKYILFLVLSFFFMTSYSQKNSFNISGKVVSKSNKQALESTTIHIERLKDSTVVSYTISDEKGMFSLKGNTFYKDLRVVVSHVGQKSFQKIIPIKQLNKYDFGTIFLEEDNVLDEVVITSRSPIVIKKDTLEFNVKSFKTKKNASVEDLLRKLPGVEVEEDGSITVNGKSVNNILVNGKPFFNDPKIATRNLTKEMIEKVQVSDSRTRAQAFSGQRGDSENKTINLTIKKDKNKGWIGRFAAGLGTNKHYEGAALVNRFNNKRRVSVLASTNNINSPGFSFGEIRGMFGGGRRSGRPSTAVKVGGVTLGGNGGLVTSKTGGVSYGDQLKKGYDVSANYFYSGSVADDEVSSNKEYTLARRAFVTTSKSTSTSENDNQKVSLAFDFKLTPSILLNINPEFVYNDRESSLSRNETSLSEDRKLINEFSSNAINNSIAKNFKNRIDLTKRFGKNGTFLKLDFNQKINSSKDEGYNKSDLKIYEGTTNSENRNQFNEGDQKSTQIGGKLLYRHAIVAKKLFVDASYSYSVDKRKNKASVYDFYVPNETFSNFNNQLSSDFINDDIVSVPKLGLRYKTKKIDVALSSGYVNRTLKSEDKLRPNLNLEKKFNAFNANANFSYLFNSRAKYSLMYNLNNSSPSVQRMQPFVDVSNPSNIIIGNPSLEPSKSHRIFTSFRKFNWQKRTGFFAMVIANFDQNAVVLDTKIDRKLIRTTTYTNLDGRYSLLLLGNYSFKIKLAPKSDLGVRLSSNFRRSKSISIFNDVINNNITDNIGQGVRLEYSIDDYLTIRPRYNISFSKTVNNANSRQNREFVTHAFTLGTTSNLFKKLELLNDVKYNYNPNIVGFNKSYWFWNSTLSYSVLRDKGAITLKAYDILNQNTNARRIATENYIEDRESSVLRQYFMLGFTWKFNSLGNMKGGRSRGKFRGGRPSSMRRR